MRALSRYIRSRALVTSNWSRQHCEPEPDALQRTGGFLMQANDASGADDARREDEALLDDDDQQLPNVYTTCSVCHRTVQVHLARSSPAAQPALPVSPAGSRASDLAPAHRLTWENACSCSI